MSDEESKDSVTDNHHNVVKNIFGSEGKKQIESLYQCKIEVCLVVIFFLLYLSRKIQLSFF